jgi:hypothetical protein
MIMSQHKHPYEKTISTIKLIRKLKLDGGIPNKPVPVAIIKVQNNFEEFLTLVSSWEDIMFMEKIEKLIFVFNDTTNPDNDVAFECTKEDGAKILVSHEDFEFIMTLEDKVIGKVICGVESNEFP